MFECYKYFSEHVLFKLFYLVVKYIKDGTELKYFLCTDFSFKFDIPQTYDFYYEGAVRYCGILYKSGSHCYGVL